MPRSNGQRLIFLSLIFLSGHCLENEGKENQPLTIPRKFSLQPAPGALAGD
jgi:hypothetical protein